MVNQKDIPMLAAFWSVFCFFFPLRFSLSPIPFLDISLEDISLLNYLKQKTIFYCLILFLYSLFAFSFPEKEKSWMPMC